MAIIWCNLLLLYPHSIETCSSASNCNSIRFVSITHFLSSCRFVVSLSIAWVDSIPRSASAIDWVEYSMLFPKCVLNLSSFCFARSSSQKQFHRFENLEQTASCANQHEWNKQKKNTHTQINHYKWHDQFVCCNGQCCSGVFTVFGV